MEYEAAGRGKRVLVAFEQVCKRDLCSVHGVLFSNSDSCATRMSREVQFDYQSVELVLFAAKCLRYSS